MTYIWLGSFGLSCALGWWCTLIGLPGNWLIVFSGALFAWLFPIQGGLGFGWGVVFVLAGLATLGEILEAIASAAGMAKGGSRRGAVGAMIGSLIGGTVGAGLGLPVPIIGPVVGVVVFASLGAMFGAFVGESSSGQAFDKSLAVGKAAFVGRLLATVAKITIASVLLAVAILSSIL